MIETLNEKFVNTWVLLRELPELISGAKGEMPSLVAQRMQQHYTDSVDILVLTPDAEVIMHQPESALPYKNPSQAYLTVLKHSVAAFEGRRTRVGKRSKLDENPISLGTALMEVLHVYGASSPDTPNDTVVKIDTTPFERGGMLHIEIQVGVGESAGTFELFHDDTELPSKEGADAALDGAWNVSPGSIGHIFHNFSRGRHFKLVATSADDQKANAFLVRVSVVPHY
ncbi:hypothetical protein J5I95_16680 [Candidatus Poribacteria bacterium]|nr:hypothetical protein [Candidatus Poribacteria bacterium]